jgi:hypothetical protein
MSAPDTLAPEALARIERESREIAAAITTLGRLLAPGMSVVVVHPVDQPATVMVTYPDGTTAHKEFHGSTLH